MKSFKKNAGQESMLMNNVFRNAGSIILLFILTVFATIPTSAHCDSYDGPVLKDAIKALETNNVELVLKWVTKDQEKEIIPLFNKTYGLKTGDAETYKIIEKYFFETLVRLHRETEGAPYTGLKPAGTTKMIIQLTDQAISSGNVDELIVKLNNHIEEIVREKYQKVAELSKVKDQSADKGRDFVEAYVEYTHAVEAIHAILEHGGGHSGH